MEGCVTVSVPRLGITVEASLMEQVVYNSVQALGYDRPKPNQLEAVLQFVSGRDTFISLPATGSGKSLCFASLPLVFDKLREVTDTPNHHSICIVLSPLNVLMQDQVTKFTAPSTPSAAAGCYVQHISVGEHGKVQGSLSSQKVRFCKKKFRPINGCVSFIWNIPPCPCRQALKRVFEELTKGRRGNVSQAFSTAFT